MFITGLFDSIAIMANGKPIIDTIYLEKNEEFCMLQNGEATAIQHGNARIIFSYSVSFYKRKKNKRKKIIQFAKIYIGTPEPAEIEHYENTNVFPELMDAFENFVSHKLDFEHPIYEAVYSEDQRQVFMWKR